MLQKSVVKTCWPSRQDSDGIPSKLTIVLGIFLYLWAELLGAEGVVVPIPVFEPLSPIRVTNDKQLHLASEMIPLSIDDAIPRNAGRVKSNARAVTIDGVRYPDTGLFIPNSFVSDNKVRAHALFHYVNRVRNYAFPYGCQPDCSDAEISFEVDVYNSEKFSLVLLPLLQSLTSRNGTKIGQAAYLGFRFSTQLSNSLGFSFGGETLKRFDNLNDLGRNAYIGFSKATSFGKKTKPNFVFNFGLGSGIYSTYGNRLLKTGFRSDRQSKVNDPNNFDFGLVGSLSYFRSERLAFGIEYSGYGVGFGPSYRPFSNLPLTVTAYFYDLLWVPSKIRWREQVTPNFFTNISYSF